MKKILFCCFLSIGTMVATAQKYCVIDSKYILEHIPEYAQAQKQLDTISAQWQKEIDHKYSDLDNMYKSYQAEKVMLSEELKKKREAEIMSREKEAKNLQQQYFGYEGALFKKRQELIKPIQDRVYNAVQKLAGQRSLDFVLDKAAGVSVFYADPKLNRSDEVLQLLGVRK